MLKIIETVTLRGFVKWSDEWKKNFQDELKKQDLKSLAKLVIYSFYSNCKFSKALKILVLEYRNRRHRKL